MSEMLNMGFNIELSKQALIKVKNESLAAAIDAVIEIQKILDKEKAKVVESVPKKAIIQSWECKACTFINIEGKAICDMCTLPAPDTAYLIVKSEEEKKKEEEEEQKKAREEEEAKQAEIDKVKKAEEEEKKKQMEEEEKHKKCQEIGDK